MDMEILEKFSETFKKIKDIKTEVAKVIVGQEKAIDLIIISLFSRGHLLLESVPGLAKSRMVEAFARVINVPFKRIQLTPDMLPQDIIGYEMPVFGTQDFVTRKGPIFGGLVLLDELNRAPEKTQAAFMQAMQEGQITIGDTTYNLNRIFTAIATENPIETGGTFQIAEAVLDRFMAKTIFSYPSLVEEEKIARTGDDLSAYDLKIVYEPDEILPVRDYIMGKNFMGLEKDRPIINYVSRLVQASRPDQADIYLSKSDAKCYGSRVRLGISPRVTKAFLRALWVYSFGILGEDLILPEHVKFLAKDLFRHRLILQDSAEFDGITSDDMIAWLLERVPIYVKGE